jgi:hypothetical protein
MGDVGAVATLLNTVASWLLSPGGFATFARRQALKQKRKEVIDALHQNDFDALHARIDELRALSTKP